MKNNSRTIERTNTETYDSGSDESLDMMIKWRGLSKLKKEKTDKRRNEERS